MKKILMGTSALAVAGAFAGQANAATWDLDWGGYYEAGIAYASSDYGSGYGDPDYDGVDVITDSEIIFTPSITLDNGLTFGVDIQLEGSSAPTDRIDESYAFVKGSFGQILIGSENSAGYKMMYGAPDVTWIGVNSSSGSSLVPLSQTNDVFRGTGGSSFIEVGRNNDAERITYFTPRFSGFQLGVSYARDGLEGNGARDDVDAAGTLHDIFDIGANYVNSFGAFDVALAGRYGVGSRAQSDDDPTVYAFGLNLGYAGFKIGGSYAKSEDDGANDGRFFDLGVSYETGPWGVSFTYSNGENDSSDVFFGDAPGDESELEQYLAGVTYKLGPGVKVGAWAGYIDLDAPNGSVNDLDGFHIGTGFKLNF